MTESKRSCKKNIFNVSKKIKLMPYIGQTYKKKPYKSSSDGKGWGWDSSVGLFFLHFQFLRLSELCVAAHALKHLFVARHGQCTERPRLI